MASPHDSRPYVVISVRHPRGRQHPGLPRVPRRRAPAALRRLARRLQEPAARAHRLEEAQELGRRRAHARHARARAWSARSSSRTRCRRSSSTSVLICGNPSARGLPAAGCEGIRAHNRWLADLCAEHPERRAGIGLVYLNDIDEAIEDVQWIAKHGLRGGVLLPHVPPDCTHIKPLYAPDYDRFWAVCQDLGRRAEPPRRHGLARLRPVQGLAADPAGRDGLVLDAQLHASDAVGRLRALPEAPVHRDRVGLRLGAGDAREPRRAVGAHAHRHGRRVPVRRRARCRPSRRASTPSATASTARARRRRASSRGRHEIGVDHLLLGQRLPALRGHLSAHAQVAAPHLPRHGPQPRCARCSARTPRGSTASTSRSSSRSPRSSARHRTRSRVPLAPDEFPKDAHTMAFS